MSRPHRRQWDDVSIGPDDMSAPHQPEGSRSAVARQRASPGGSSSTRSGVLRRALGYDSAHKRARRTLDMRRCVQCGKDGPTQAALIHGRGHLLDGGRVYSDNPEDYVALCRACHNHYDAPARRKGRAAAARRALEQSGAPRHAPARMLRPAGASEGSGRPCERTGWR